MTKLINALKRTLRADEQAEVHFHQGQIESFPEVCHDGACQRPQLQL